jgi:hypothetical protein
MVLAQKRLELLHELVPKAELLALLVNPTSPVAEPQTQDAHGAAPADGVGDGSVRVTRPQKITWRRMRDARYSELGNSRCLKI